MKTAILIALMLVCSCATEPSPEEYADRETILASPGYPLGKLPLGTWEYVVSDTYKLWFIETYGMEWFATQTGAGLRQDPIEIQREADQIWFAYKGFYFWGRYTGSNITGYAIYKDVMAKITLHERKL